MQTPQSRRLNGRRLHLNHGPIDLIVQAWGRDWQKAYAQADARFQTVLEGLVVELDLLRRVLDGTRANGVIANRMIAAVAPHEGFVTPMAAVAGAVADEVCAAMCLGLSLERAYVNNGGDIAVFLREDHTLRAAIPGFGAVTMQAVDPARGLATSGWRGRSLSLGIADAVSVLAKDAAAADVAATLIANAVDLSDHKAISRQAAVELQPDSDLGTRLVTVAVAALSREETSRALNAGQSLAGEMLANGLIDAAALFLNDQTRIVGGFPTLSQTDQPDS